MGLNNKTVSANPGVNAWASEKRRAMIIAPTMNSKWTSQTRTICLTQGISRMVFARRESWRGAEFTYSSDDGSVLEKSRKSFSLRELSVRCLPAGNFPATGTHRGDAETAEDTQRFLTTREPEAKGSYQLSLPPNTPPARKTTPRRMWMM